MADGISEDNERAYVGLGDLAALLDQGVSQHLPESEDPRPLYVAWGLLAAAQRQAAAVVLLHRKGFGHEAAANRRSLLEHMARIWWLVEDGSDAVDSMNRELQRSHKKLRKAADAARMTYDATIADAVKTSVLPPNSAEVYNHFAHLFERIGYPLGAAWVAETQLAHPTLTAAQCFFDDSASGRVSLFSEPKYRGSADNLMDGSPYVAFAFLWSAIDAFNRMLEGKPWADELQRIARDGGLDGASHGMAS